MATIASIRADLIGSSAVFRAEMVRGAQQANQSLVSIRAETKATADSIVAMNRAAAGFIGFQAVKRGVGDLLDAQLKMQSIHYTLLAATGSAQLAGKAFEFVQDRAHVLGLDLQPTAEGFAKLSASASALGVPMKDQMDLFDAYAKSSTALHLSSEQSNRALLALEQMFGKGKIQAQELRLQLGQAIPGAAARFQNAVMEMVKGTDLAGKSFDQLMEAGALTTAKFLPALTEAMRASGRGWEPASHGMNAELNRLRTNWFQMKADVSGGLFNDVATDSIRLMADNLQNLANVAGVTGGLVVSRLAGVGLGKAYDAGAGAVAAQRQAREAAEAAGAVAKANVEAAAAQVKSNEAALQGATVARKQAFEQRGAAEALHAKALAENNAAQATLAHQQGAMTLSANIRAQREATAAAAVAQNNLARAQRQYDAAVVGGNALKQQQIALEARLIEAKAASAAATEAQIVAERQLAATTSGGLLARGARSLGSFAMGLVGGPWGLALAAVGGLGYALYSAKKRSDEFDASVQNQIKSLLELDASLGNVRERYDDFATRPAFATIQADLDTATKAVADFDAKLAEVRSKYADAKDRNERQVARGLSTPNTPELDKLRQQLADLEAVSGPAERKLADLRGVMADQMRPAVADLSKEFEGAGSAWDKFMVALGASGQLDDAKAKIIAAQTAVSAKIAELEGSTAKAKLANDTFGQSGSQSLATEHRQFVEQNKAAGEALLSQADAAFKGAEAEARRREALEAGKKAADRAASAAASAARQYENLLEAARGHGAELDAQAAGTDKLTTSEKLLASTKTDLLDKRNGEYRAILQANAAKERAIRVTEQEHAADLRSIALKEQLQARIDRQTEQNQIDALGVGHGSQFTQQLQEELRIRQEYDRQRRQYDKEAGRLDPGAAGAIGTDKYNVDLAAMMVAQQQELAIYRAGVQQRLDAEAEWKNGAIRAMEDWSAAAANNADLAAGVITNAATNMTNAFVEFAATGKLSFKDFADSLIRDLARIAYQKAIAGLFDYALGALMPSAVGAGSGYLGGNGAGGYGMQLQGAPGRAGGGSTSGGSIYEVAEGGRPELFQSGGRTYLLSGQDGHVTPASRGNAAANASASAGDIEVQINITNNGQAVQAQQTGQRMDGKKMIVDMVLQAVQSDIAKGGGTAQAMQQRFGLQRRGVPVGG